MATTTSDRVHVVATVASEVVLRRWLQLALAGLWLYAGLLQGQSYMFTRAFAAQMLDSAAAGNPRWLASTIHWNASLIAAHPLMWNLLFMLTQIALGLGIAYRPTRKPALAASIVWSVMVWWLGEGFGGLLTGHASAVTGAPGAVILYALLAVLLWPSVPERAPGKVCFAADHAVGPTAARALWIALWGGFALLNLQPANGGPDGFADLVSGSGSGQPGWISATARALGHATQGHGVLLTALETALLVLIALGVLFPVPIARSAVVGAAVVAALFWVVGQALGAPFGGQATDPNSGPLLLVVAAAYWPWVKAEAEGEDRCTS